MQSALHSDLPLVIHVIYRFDVGWVRESFVNLINHMPRG
jgi:hypothetical protein